MKIIAATQNKGKLKEISEIFSKAGFEVVSQKESGFDIDVEETGTTFSENAYLKAEAIHKLSNEAVIADDSGLMVDALDGAPGVYSARYAGEGATDDDRIEKLLFEMKDKKDRKARFVTSMVVILPDGRRLETSGEVLGSIAYEKHGENGFGYDPVFISDELSKTFGEASSEEKNRISHRARALKKMYEILSREINI